MAKKKNYRFSIYWLFSFYGKKSSNEYLKKVSEIRKYPRKSKEYDNIKKTLPCFTTAFNFRGYISNKNIGKSTGYLYLDIDDSDNIDLEHPSIVFYCKSISNKVIVLLLELLGLLLIIYKSY